MYGDGQKAGGAGRAEVGAVAAEEERALTQRAQRLERRGRGGGQERSLRFGPLRRGPSVGMTKLGGCLLNWSEDGV